MLLPRGVRVAYSQFYVLDHGADQPLLEQAYHGQTSGLCGARTGRSLFLTTGLHTGVVPVEIAFMDAEPRLEAEWEEAVDASIELTGSDLVVLGWAGESSHTVPVPSPGTYRIRYCASGMDAGRNLDTAYDRPAPDRYRLQFWPGPLGPTMIVRQTSEIARYWHGVVGTIAPPADRDLSSTPMPAPPAPGSALTPGDLDRLTDRWASAWGRRTPSAARLGVQLGDPGVTFRLLPVGKNYPATNDEMSRLMTGYLQLLVALGDGSTSPILITHGWQDGTNVSPGRDEYLARFTPKATFWRTDDLGREPGFTSLIHSFALRLTDPSGALPVIELFVQDGTDDVLLVDDELRWTVVFRNGGMEVLTSDQGLLDRLTAIAAATSTVGTVRTWHDEEGWGVIDSPETPGGSWVHFSAVAVAGHRSHSPGQRVHLEWEQVVDQDGHRFRATRVWPVGAEPVETVPQPPNEAHRTAVTMTVSFDSERPGAGRG